jgi:hypothetical protein
MSRGSELPLRLMMRMALVAVVAGCSAGESCAAGCEMPSFTISGGEDAAVYTTSAPVPVARQEPAPVNSAEARREEGSYSASAADQSPSQRGGRAASEADTGDPGYTVVRRYSQPASNATLAEADASSTTGSAVAGDGAMARANDAGQAEPAAQEEAEVPAGSPPEPVNIVVVTPDVPPVAVPRTNVASPTPRSVNYPMPPVPPLPGR